MTRARHHGGDHEFCAWMRKQTDLPSWSPDSGFVATDIDLCIHLYMSAIDGQGTREVQSLMDLEVKTRGSDVTASQRDTLFKRHLCIRRGVAVKHRGQLLRHWGQSFVFLSGKDPDDSAIEWGRFKDDGKDAGFIRRTPIDREVLILLMKFELHPDSLSRQPLRRHHKTRKVVVQKWSGLGFWFGEELDQSS